MSKRQKFVIATFVLLAGIILSRVALGQFLQWRFRLIIYAAISLLVTVWAIRDEDFSGVEWLTLPILPTMFSLGSVLVFPLLPPSFDSFLSWPISPDSSLLLVTALKILFLAAFIVGYYATVLTANIYNVAAIRNIQLLRVAHSIGFLVTVVTALLFYMVLFSFHLSGFYNFILVFALSAPLVLQALWSVNLFSSIDIRTRNYSLFGAVVLGEAAWALSFWPIGISIIALFLTAIFYEMVGIMQYHFSERLNKRVVNEFIFVVIAIFFITLFTAQWGA